MRPSAVRERERLLGELAGVEGGVGAALVEEFLVGAFFRDVAFLHVEDEVGIADGGVDDFVRVVRLLLEMLTRNIWRIRVAPPIRRTGSPNSPFAWLERPSSRSPF